jgi:hypothetical protein
VSALIPLAHAALVLAIALAVAVLLERSPLRAALPVLVSVLAAASALAIAAMLVNHARYPFHLDLMEGVVQQHARRALHGESLYPLASPEFVPLAYNALYYVLAAPFLLVLGDSLATLRIVAILGYLGAAAAIFCLVRGRTRSAWWGAVACGLFFAAYSAMDAYLDTAHSDSWLLCTALWGTYLVDRESRGARFAGILVLTTAFWFKQHGVIFLGAALVYLTWREGARSAVYWLAAIVGAPLLYLFAPASLVGPAFHFFTWHVPSGWSQFTSHTIPRVIVFVAQSYPVLALVALAGAYHALRVRAVGILELMLGAAFLTAFMGSLDPGASYNVFIPMGAFCIVYGSIELARLNERAPLWRGLRLPLVALLLAFATLLHDPRAFWMSASARASYAELRTTLRSLPGPVYAPGIGQLSNDVVLHPAAHWVALDDIMRGPKRTAADSNLARQLLDGARHPAQSAFVLTNRPLADLAPPVSELDSSYVLVKDYGQRFALLHSLPRRFDQRFPRYLYRSTGEGAPAHVP